MLTERFCFNALSELETLTKHTISFILDTASTAGFASYFWLKKHWEKIVKYYNHPKFKMIKSAYKYKKFTVNSKLNKASAIITSVFNNREDKKNVYLYTSNDGKTITKELLSIKKLAKRRKEKFSLKLAKYYIPDEEGDLEESDYFDGIYETSYLDMLKRKEKPKSHNAKALLYYDLVHDNDYAFYFDIKDIKQKEKIIEYAKVLSSTILRKKKSSSLMLLNGLTASMAVRNAMMFRYRH